MVKTVVYVSVPECLIRGPLVPEDRLQQRTKIIRSSAYGLCHRAYIHTLYIHTRFILSFVYVSDARRPQHDDYTIRYIFYSRSNY